MTSIFINKYTELASKILNTKSNPDNNLKIILDVESTMTTDDCYYAIFENKSRKVVESGIIKLKTYSDIRPFSRKHSSKWNRVPWTKDNYKQLVSSTESESVNFINSYLKSALAIKNS